MWETKGKKYKMPTFLWLEKEEPRGYPENQGGSAFQGAGALTHHFPSATD